MPRLRRLRVDVQRMTVCERGHGASYEPTGEKQWVSACPHCGAFTWEDGSFCVRCGGALTKPPANIDSRIDKTGENAPG